MYQKTKLKLDKDGFNNLSKGEWFAEWFETEGYKPECVDLDKEQHPYWQNDNATLVVVVRSMTDAIQIGKLATEGMADEFHSVKVIDGYVIRLWWD